MIALTLVGTCILPLSELPMRAIREEFRSAYRMQSQRLADLAFAKVKEKLHKEEISWKEISKTRGDRAIVLTDDFNVCLEPAKKKEDLVQRKFLILGTLYSVGKQGQNSEEWRLATVCIRVTPEQKKFKLFRTKKGTKESRTYTYQVLIHKTAAADSAPIETPSSAEVTEGERGNSHPNLGTHLIKK